MCLLWVIVGRFTWIQSKKTFQICELDFSQKLKTSLAKTNFVSASLGADPENSKSGGRDTAFAHLPAL